MRAIIFINGIISDYEPIKRLLRDDDYLIGADGGTHHCLAVGKVPHVVVGDLDSLETAQIERLTEQGVQFENHAPEKNETDLELAIVRALCNGADEIILVGAMGGRLDQMLANLFIMAQRAWSAAISLVEGDQRAQLVRGGETLMLDAPIGATISALPLSERVTGITYTGLQYPLTDFTMDFGSTRGISNVLLESPATIYVATGVLLVTQAIANAAE